METARFYDPTFHALNPFSPHMIEWEWVLYPTLEHAYHTLRYPQQKHKDMILAAKSPRQAWEISQTLKEYQSPDWSEKKVDVVRKLMKAKAEQHGEVRDALKLSGNMSIIKDIPEDAFWWVWPDGKWQNIMGKIWEEIREKYM